VAETAVINAAGNAVSLKIDKTLKEIFRPEFLNRVDEVIEFNELTKDELKEICTLMLKDMKNELSSMGIDFEITDEAKDALPAFKQRRGLCCAGRYRIFGVADALLAHSHEK